MPRWLESNLTTEYEDAAVRLYIQSNHGLLARNPIILLEFRPGLSGKQSEANPGTDYPHAGRRAQ